MEIILTNFKYSIQSSFNPSVYCVLNLKSCSTDKT